ncbi:MAG: hypothetical protein DVB22_001956 [Verrucomicrobia bacterium]|nr:MAG: hypothetical protein DVB22_001956 [Verrucomicrobiota bacterium]
MNRSNPLLCIVSSLLGCLVGIFTLPEGHHPIQASPPPVGRTESHQSLPTKEIPSETELAIGKRWDAGAQELADTLSAVPMNERQSLLPIRTRDDGVLLCTRLLDLTWPDLQELLGDSLLFALRLAREENPLVLKTWMRKAVAEGHAGQLAHGWWDLHPQGKQLFVETLLPLSTEYPELLDSRATPQTLEIADVPQLTLALSGLEKLESSHHVTRAVKTAADRIATLDPAKAAEILASTSNPDIREALMKRLPAQITDNFLAALPPDHRDNVFAAQAAQSLTGTAPVAEVAASLGRMSTTSELDSQVKEVVSSYLEHSADATRVYDAALLIEDETLRTKFIQQTTASLAQLDPHEASLQLDRVMQSGHPIPDTAIVALIGQIRNDPEACRIWAQHLADPNLKQEMLSRHNIQPGEPIK